MEQGKRYTCAAGDFVSAERELTGMIRTAILLSETLLVTDSMLLDGAYFLSVGPEGLAHRLGLAGQPLPIVVLTSHPTLRESLAAKRSDPTFTWQVEADGLARAELGREETWLAWVLASESGLFTIERYTERDGAAKNQFDLVLPAEPDGVAQPTPAAALATLAREQGWRKRSEFMNAHRLAVSLADPADLPGLDRTHRWWNDAYRDALATQNDADWIRFDDAPGDDEISLAPGRRERLRLSGSIVTEMTEAPAAVFATLLFTLRDQRQTFRARPSQRALRSLAYGVSSTPVSPSRFEVIRGSLLRFGFALMAFVVGTPLVPSRVGTIDTVWIGLAVLAVATIPWSELLTVYTTSARNLRGVVSVNRNAS